MRSGEIDSKFGEYLSRDGRGGQISEIAGLCKEGCRRKGTSDQPATKASAN